jgi:hypothetical protein
MSKQMKLITVIGLIALAIISRFVYHIPNISPIMAISLFAGAYIDDKRFAFGIPLLSMFLSDLFIGFHPAMIAVYGSLVLVVAFGILLKNRVSVKNTILSAISGSVVFFVLTNFASWLIDPMYMPLSIESIVRCYNLAIPFFRNSLIGDMVFTGVLFGAYQLAERGFLKVAINK